MPTISANGATIFYQSEGAGEPLLMIPGLGLDHTYYAQGLPYLTPSVRTITVDPRGVGQSSKDQVVPSVDLWADDFAAFIEAMGEGPMHVLGTSLGGSIALSLAARHPARVKSLIAVGAFSELNESVHLNYSLRKRLIAKIGLSEEMADFIALWIMTPQFMESEAGAAIAANMRRNIQKNDPVRYTGFLDAILDLGKRECGGPVPALTARLSSITAPTLVACADNDHFIPASLSRVIADAIPGAQYVDVPKGGHIPFIEQPEAIARAVVAFLTSLPDGKS
jgi:pimeloyl-ACP methyl ester carboxylesterase